MVRAKVIVRAALVLGASTASATADARPATSHTAPSGVPPASEKAHSIQWKLWVGKKAYGLSSRGGAASLPGETQWRCSYSGPVLGKNKKNLREETVTLVCSAGSAQFSFSTTCGYPVDPTKPVAEGVMPSEFQHVVLGGRTFVGVSCDVPGFELRTYRKKEPNRREG